MNQSDFTHRYTRRKRGHDYKAPCIYHIILHKAATAPDLGSLVGDPRIAPGNPGCANIAHSLLGNIIEREICNLPSYNASIEIYQYKVMPDHVHILLHVMAYLPKAIGSYIGGMKTGVKKKWHALRQSQDSSAQEEPVFEDNFTDKIIHPGRKLDPIFKYIRENPHRLAIRKFYPVFFQRIRNITVNGELFEAYGNIFHLRNPFKSQVIVHHYNTAKEIEEMHCEWMREAITGGVLVSPFISKPEKKAYNEAVSLGGRIIYIQNESFSERYKPSQREFNLCCEGRLLLMAPVQSYGKDISKPICNRMNKIAEEIAKGNFTIG